MLKTRAQKTSQSFPTGCWVYYAFRYASIQKNNAHGSIYTASDSSLAYWIVGLNRLHLKTSRGPISNLTQWVFPVFFRKPRISILPSRSHISLHVFNQILVFNQLLGVAGMKACSHTGPFWRRPSTPVLDWSIKCTAIHPHESCRSLALLWRSQ